MSRVLSLSPAEAESSLAAWENSFTKAPPGRRGGVEVALTGGTAELRPAPLRGASRGCRRRLVGVLRSSRRLVCVPIELEVGPWWPGVKAELRVRPIGATCLRRMSHHRLFARLAPVLAERVILGSIAP